MFLFFKYKCRENFNTYETDTYLPLIQNISATYMYSVYIVFRTINQRGIYLGFNLDPLKSTITVFW